MFVLQLMIPKVMGVDVPKDKMDAALEDLNTDLNLIEKKFLQDRPFIIGDQMSLADLVAIVELMQVSRRPVVRTEETKLKVLVKRP